MAEVYVRRKSPSMVENSSIKNLVFSIQYFEAKNSFRFLNVYVDRI